MVDRNLGDHQTPAGPGAPFGSDWSTRQEEDGLDSFDRMRESSFFGGRAAMETSTSLVLASAATREPSTASTALPSQTTVVCDTTTGMAVCRTAHTFDGHDSTWLNTAEMKKVLGRVPQPLERPSCLNALAFNCEPCQRKCTRQLDEVNVTELRQGWQLQLANMGFEADQSKAVKQSLFVHYDQSAKKFRDFNVQVTGRDGLLKQVALCPASWATVVPCEGWGTFTKLRAEVTSEVQKTLSFGRGAAGSESALKVLMPPKFLLQEGKALQTTTSEGEKFKLVKSYVKQLASTLEMNPAPGACRQVEYIAPKETWDVRCKACEDFFAEKGKPLAGGVSRHLLQACWRSVGSIVDKAMKSHAKCSFCSLCDSQLCSLIGKVDAISVQKRAKLRQDLADHRKLMADERGELDDAGFRSMVYPVQQMTMIADGATQNNFMLPKLRKRKPKELATKALFCSKLYGVFLYGFGMNSYLVHESVGGGG